MKQEERFGLLIIGLLSLTFSVGSITAGFKPLTVDMGVKITKVATNKHFSDIYVGGENFIASFNHDMQLMFNLSIGPVKEPEHCHPNPAPCPNIVRVLQIDEGHQKLIVCGSAYGGTCTMHFFPNLCNWFCMKAAPNASHSTVVSSSGKHTSSTHFISRKEMEIAFDVDIDDPWYDCRSGDFLDQCYWGLPINDTEYPLADMPLLSSDEVRGGDAEITDYSDGTNKDSNSDESQSGLYHKGDTSSIERSILPIDNIDMDYDADPFSSFFGRRFESRLMVASFQEDYGWGQTRSNQPLISMRYISHIFSNDFKMLYTGGSDGEQAQGIFIDPDIHKYRRFKIDFTLSFAQGNFSYFLSVQSGFCPDDAQSCTMLSRVPTLATSLLPYVEIPIKCSHDDETYPILTAAVIGTVGLRQSSGYEEVNILVMAFGRATAGDDSGSEQPDRKQGTAICAYPLHNLDNQEFNFIQNVCEVQGNDPSGNFFINVPWSVQTDQACQMIRSQSFGQSHKAIEFLPDTLVTSLLTHTQTVKKTTGISWMEKMHVYAVHPTNPGIKMTKHFEMTVTNSRRAGTDGVDNYKVKSSQVDSFREGVNDFVPDVKQYSMYPPVGNVDHVRAMMYLAYGTQLFSLSLDFCRQYTSCGLCHSKGIKECRWCQKSMTCKDKDSTTEECGGSSEGSCPPLIQSFEPRAVPVSGGSTLTIRGTHLGEQKSSGNVTVTICDKPCTAVLANVNSLTCKVHPEPECQWCDMCIINVTVTGSKNSQGTGLSVSKLNYVIPSVDIFEPSFGPVSGGNLLELWGENLNIGTNREVQVAGVPCKILPSTSNEEAGRKLTCRMADGTGYKNECGELKLRIDDFFTTSRHKKYCFKPDPLITHIKPMSTIESGGLKLVVSGKNFNSTSRFELFLTIQKEKRRTTFTSECSKGDEDDTMVCVTPNMRNETKRVFEVSKNTDYLKASVEINIGGTFARFIAAGSFFIRRDPILFHIDESDENYFIYPKMRDKLFPITGKYLPVWMNVSDIIIMIGRTRCPVVVISDYKIFCNVTDVLRAYRVDRRNLKFSTTTTMIPVITTTSMLNETVRDNITDSITKTTFPQSNITTGTTRPSTILTTQIENNETTPFPRNSLSSQPEYSKSTSFPGNLTLRSDRSPENLVLYNKSKLSMIDLDVAQYRKARRKVKSPLVYTINVKIGNWQDKDLGSVVVGPFIQEPEDEPPPSTGRLLLQPTVIAIIALAAILILVIPIVVCVVCHRQKQKNVVASPFYMGSLSGKSMTPMGSGEAAIPTLAEILQTVLEPSKRDAVANLIIDLDHLQLGKSIGSGNFGCVYEGMLSRENKPQMKVAIKTLQDPSSHSLNLTGFVQEAVIMMDFIHENVLGLVGLSEREPGIPYVVLPYMENGDLLTYVRDIKRSLSLYDVIQFGADICNGMAYLNSLKFVHRDLAARNCIFSFVTSMRTVSSAKSRSCYTIDMAMRLDMHYRVKVADFGLCRDIYEKGYYTSDNKKKLPIRWMAIESIENGAYSTKSDVWSMGVVLWELLTRGMTPYPGVDGWDILNFLRRRRLSPPFFCPDHLYRLMMNCWAKDPNLRPTFKALQKELLLLVGKELQSNPNTPKHSRSNHAYDKLRQSENMDAEKELYVIPKIKINQGQGSVSESSHRKGSEDRNLNNTNKSGSVMSLPRSKLVKNAKITVPACYEYRDIKKEAIATYVELVDNYEPAPRFSNPFLRSKKNRNKSRDKNSKELNTPIASRNSDIKTNSTGYSIPVSLSANPNIMLHRAGSEGQLIDMIDRKGSMVFGVSDDGPYYELEHGKRVSADVSLNSSYHSSILMDKTASVDNVSCHYGGRSSLAASSQSINSTRRPASNRSSGIVNVRYSPVNFRPDIERNRTISVPAGNASLKEEEEEMTRA